MAALKTGARMNYLMKSNLKRLLPAIDRELREAAQRRERRDLERNVRQLQKFEAIGRLAGGIAHDFNNVLGAIMGWAELALDEAPPGSRMQDRLQKILNQGESAARLTAQLLVFARRQVLQRKRTDLNAVVHEGTSLLSRVIGEHIEVRIVPAADLRVTLADPGQIEQVLMNLCLNARDAMPNGGKLVIETRNVEIDEEFCRKHTSSRPGSYVLLSVTDTGTGMDAATIEHIFEPFFTTKELGKGTGLGLATVYGVVRQHGGFVHVSSEPGAGTSFRIYLRSEDGEPDPLGDDNDEPARSGSETILLAEDHDGLRQSTREMLVALGYHVLVASNGAEAVRVFKEHSNRIDVLVFDVVMPDLTGPEAYAQIVIMQPDINMIFTTGYTNEAASLLSMVEKGACVLQKPYTAKKLTHVIGKLCSSKESQNKPAER